MKIAKKIKSVYDRLTSSQRLLAVVVLSVIGTIVVTTAIRYSRIEEEHHTHLHANFNIVIDGETLDLSDERFQEDVSLCVIEGEEVVQPISRAHMHENKGDIVHVHHDGVTWGHFFSNIGYTLSNDYLIDDTGKIYKNEGDKKLSFILNGKAIYSPYNQLINKNDRLLINYGTESEDELIDTRFKDVPDSAAEYNTKADPASCSGDHHEATFMDKLKDALFN